MPQNDADNPPALEPKLEGLVVKPEARKPDLATDRIVLICGGVMAGPMLCNTVGTNLGFKVLRETPPEWSQADEPAMVFELMPTMADTRQRPIRFSMRPQVLVGTVEQLVDTFREKLLRIAAEGLMVDQPSYWADNEAHQAHLDREAPRDKAYPIPFEPSDPPK